MTENARSILSVNFSVQLQQTEISERKLFIFHLGLCAIADIAGNSVRSLTSPRQSPSAPHRAPISSHQAPISSHRMTSVS